MREPLWKSRFQWRNSNTSPLERKEKNEFGCIGEGKRKSLRLPHIAFPPRQHSSGPRDIFSTHDSSWGESESWWRSTQLPQLRRMPPKRATCLSLHPASWAMSCMTGRWEEAGRAADKALRGIQRLWILLTASQTPSRSPSRSLWACLSADSPTWPTGNPRALHASPTHTSTLWPALRARAKGSRSLGRQLMNMRRETGLLRDYKFQL